MWRNSCETVRNEKLNVIFIRDVLYLWITMCISWGFLHVFTPECLFCAFGFSRWAKGGVVIQGARESVFVTKADHSFFTEPVSCQVFNAVGSTNVSILVDVQCKYKPKHFKIVQFNGIC